LHYNLVKLKYSNSILSYCFKKNSSTKHAPGDPEHFSGFEFFLLSGIFPARPKSANACFSSSMYALPEIQKNVYYDMRRYGNRAASLQVHAQQSVLRNRSIISLSDVSIEMLFWGNRTSICRSLMRATTYFALQIESGCTMDAYAVRSGPQYWQDPHLCDADLSPGGANKNEDRLQREKPVSPWDPGWGRLSAKSVFRQSHWAYSIP